MSSKRRPSTNWRSASSPSPLSLIEKNLAGEIPHEEVGGSISRLHPLRCRHSAVRRLPATDGRATELSTLGEVRAVRRRPRLSCRDRRHGGPRPFADQCRVLYGTKVSPARGGVRPFKARRSQY